MTTTDLVMPKLGLTMTEGKVAQWKAAPGSRFETGDIIVVVETDKIAYDVEAPSSGILQEVLASEGSVVSVGTPIGRWDVGDIKISPDTLIVETTAAPAVATSAPSETRTAPVAAAARGERARLLATPFARRLAREAGIDLREVNGTGPNGRITGADVEHAVASARAQNMPAVTPIAGGQSRESMRRIGIEIDLTALLAINEEINRELPDLQPDLIHYVVLAAAKSSEFFPTPPILGLALNRENPAETISILASAHCRTLREVIAQTSVSIVSEASEQFGALLIERALDGITFLSSDPPKGWLASLAVGSVREVLRSSVGDRAVPTALVNVILTYCAAELDAVSAQRLLLKIGQSLEAPLFLLAS